MWIRPGQMALTRMRWRASSTADVVRQVDDRRLGRRVGLRAATAAEAGDRRGVDDAAAAALLDHHPRRVLRPDEHAAHEHGERAVPVVDADLGERPERTADAGVVEQHVETAEALDGGTDQRLDVVLLGDVGAHEAAGGRGRRPPRRGAWPFSALKSPTTTLAPSSRKRSTVARPMPLAPPVMTATRSESTGHGGDATQGARRSRATGRTGDQRPLAMASRRPAPGQRRRGARRARPGSAPRTARSAVPAAPVRSNVAGRSPDWRAVGAGRAHALRRDAPGRTAGCWHGGSSCGAGPDGPARTRRSDDSSADHGERMRTPVARRRPKEVSACRPALPRLAGRARPPERPVRRVLDVGHEPAGRARARRAASAGCATARPCRRGGRGASRCCTAPCR